MWRTPEETIDLSQVTDKIFSHNVVLNKFVWGYTNIYWYPVRCHVKSRVKFLTDQSVASLPNLQVLKNPRCQQPCMKCSCNNFVDFSVLEYYLLQVKFDIIFKYPKKFHQMKAQEHHTVRTVPKSNWKIIQTESQSIP
jgi:hypothetical protein